MRPVTLQVRSRRPVVVLADYQYGRNNTTLRPIAAVFIQHDHEDRRPPVAVPEHAHALGWAIVLDNRYIGVFDLFAVSPRLADRKGVIGGCPLSKAMDRVIGEFDGVALAVGQRVGVVARGVLRAHSAITTVATLNP